jgi:PAS domain S-box-containing protein
MRLHPITLAFREPHRRLEGPFSKFYFQKTLGQVRLALAISVLLFAIYGIIDALVVPDKKDLFWVMRWGIVCPIGLALWGFTYSRHAFRYLQPALCLGTLACGLVMIAMLVLAPLDKQYTYLAGLVQILFFIYTFLRIRFIWASTTFWLLLITYVALTITRLPHDRLISDVAFLFGINLMGMLVCYSMEYFTRRDFFLSRQLESKKRRLHTANQLLEKRVEDRTAELTRSNQRLEEEIRERKTIGRALQESKSRYRRMVNNVTDYVFVHDMRGHIVEFNHRMTTGLGYSYKEMAELNLQDLMVPEQRPFFDKYIARLRNGQKATGTTTLVTKTGRLRLMEYSNVMSQNTSGEDVVYCLARDITDRHNAERALAESQARFNDIFETAAAGMMIVHSRTGKVVEVNPAAAQMFGEPIERIKGRTLDTLVHSEESQEERVGQLSGTASLDPVEGALVTRDKGLVPILKTMRPMEFHGQPHWITSFISIQKIKEAETAQREVERMLNHAQHLQAIGTLAGGIAHDFNNILYGIIGYTQLAMDDAPENSLLRDNLAEVMTGSQRAKELIAQILAFSRRDDTRKKPITPAPLVKEALKLLRASIPSTVEIQTDTAAGMGTIMANPTQIHQVIMNLCTNAAHAMRPHGGLMQVALDHVAVTEEELVLHGRLTPGDYVRIRVTDNGSGMPANILNRIFEPFFTTKAQGEGAGMGLAVVLGIVQAHEGAIRVQSELGKGSCFEVLLPVAAPAGIDDGTQDLPSPGGSERVLLVDDERAVVKMERQMLTKLGYRVTTCHDPLEALALFRRRPDDFDLVITDLTMPKLKGTQLARHLLHIRPDLPILMCTGYGDDVAEQPRHLADLGIRELILKPSPRHHLAAAIRRALSQPQQQAPLIDEKRHQPCH